MLLLSPDSVCRVNKIKGGGPPGANNLPQANEWQQPQIVQP
ncbi:hypothetical protein HMPREF1144_5556 [Klebsiella sp. OBRC7]|nr:hypothetical protein HMPREF1144_5556 [Klebsiella sp. OBRC7]